jgi:ABC-type nitrate/sulfonate/bicarbonate transport system, permease component
MTGSTPSSAAAPRLSRLWAGILGVALLLLAWEALALAMGKELVLPSPLSVFREALALYPTPSFLAALLATFLRGLAAFGLSAAIGIAVGLAAGLKPLFAAAIAPALTVIRATPVLALALVALLWFPSGFVPIFTAFLMAFPVMVTSAAQGAQAPDRRLLEMAALFRVPPRRVFLSLRLPAAAPHLLSGAKSSLGISWKVVVAGEILSQPARALGTGMQESRLMLESASVFAWALAAIVLCGLTEWAFEWAARRASRHGL